MRQYRSERLLFRMRTPLLNNVSLTSSLRQRLYLLLSVTGQGVTITKKNCLYNTDASILLSCQARGLTPITWIHPNGRYASYTGNQYIDIKAILRTFNSLNIVVF